MRINSIQQNQVNCRGGIHFSEAKAIPKTKPFGSVPVINGLFINASGIIDMYSAIGIDPFVASEGYKTIINTMGNNEYAVKCDYDRCMQLWSLAMNSDAGTIFNENI